MPRRSWHLLACFLITVTLCGPLSGTALAQSGRVDKPAAKPPTTKPPAAALPFGAIAQPGGSGLRFSKLTTAYFSKSDKIFVTIDSRKRIELWQSENANRIAMMSVAPWVVVKHALSADEGTLAVLAVKLAPDSEWSGEWPLDELPQAAELRLLDIASNAHRRVALDRHAGLADRISFDKSGNVLIHTFPVYVVDIKTLNVTTPRDARTAPPETKTCWHFSDPETTIEFLIGNRQNELVVKCGDAIRRIYPSRAEAPRWVLPIPKRKQIVVIGYGEDHENDWQVLWLDSANGNRVRECSIPRSTRLRFGGPLAESHMIASVLVPTTGRSQLRAWNIDSGEIEVDPRLPDWFAPDFTANKNGSIVAVLTDHAARLHNTETRRTIADLSGHHGEIRRLEFTPDSKEILSYGADGTSRVWDVATGEMRRSTYSSTSRLDGEPSLTMETEPATEVEGEESRMERIPPAWHHIVVREDATGKLRARVKVPSERSQKFTLSPGGEYLAQGDSVRNTLRLIETTGKNNVVWRALQMPARASALAFSADGKYLAAGFENSEILVWEVSRLTERK